MRYIFAFFIVITACQADPDNALQVQIDKACKSQQPFKLPKGRTVIYSPITLSTNCKIIGGGPDFGTVLQPMGVQAFVIDGNNVQGGWAFRNTLEGFTIDASTSDVAELITINKSYTTKIDRVFIFSQVAVIGIKISDSNHIQLNELVMYGESQAGKTGIHVSGDTSVTMNDVDLENYSRCMKTFGGTTTVNSPYMERCVVNIEHHTGTLTVFGGLLKSSNGYNVGLFGNSFNAYSTKFESYQGAELTGKIMHCFNVEYINVEFEGITPYSGYLQNTNCPDGLI